MIIGNVWYWGVIKGKICAVAWGLGSSMLGHDGGFSFIS
jgi:hypothetical protein